ncbi:pseudaminic acid cytidylyltransferase [Pseudofulvibacter geojedonensis]|uniref:Pseudaminic acid cytidylyltransferase n=1 Tax=Pseudofulvibacter geojedonensis TaxID=1123758 RepID=A0ABW3HZL0_9FLAO
MASLAIIPARGGSKRIPKKNIKDFLGVPIISYSIKSAINSELFDEVMVSTDDEEIKNIAESFDAKVPFLRGNSNSDDFATLADVLQEVLACYKEEGKEFTSVCCILPTAPFVNSEKLIKSFKIYQQEKFDTVFPVLEFSYPIQRALRFEGENIEMVEEKYLNSRSQDLEARYHDSGQFYWINVERFLLEKKMFTANSGAIVISELEAQDIDTITDWKLAEIKYQMMLKNEKNNL